jgi:hypothetical protein
VAGTNRNVNCALERRGYVSEGEIYKIRDRAAAWTEYWDYFFGELNREVAPLLELLGSEALLIPEIFGGKRPRLRGWNALTHEALADPAHYYFRALADAVLAGGNIGVLLGKVSGDLCTVDLDREEAVEPFLRKNPRLRSTLFSTGSGVGGQFWLRIREGYYIPKVLKICVTESLAARYGGVARNPATGTFDIGEWRGGQKSTIWGVHESGTAYRILVRAKPIELTMEEILLPVGWRLRFIRPTEFGPVEGDDCGLTPEAALIAKADRRVAERRRWRGGGGSH